jgi:hypothetical protein
MGKSGERDWRKGAREGAWAGERLYGGCSLDVERLEILGLGSAK